MATTKRKSTMPESMIPPAHIIRARGEKVPVSMRALIQRINRTLKPDLETLKITRGEQMRREVGDYYRLNLRYNCISGKHMDPEEYGRNLGVLQPWETVVE